MAAMVEIMYWELGRLNWSATDRAFPCRWGRVASVQGMKVLAKN